MNPHVSYMSQAIHQINAGSGETLVLNMVKVFLPRTMFTVPKKNNRLKENNAIVNSTIDEILLHEN